MRPTTLSRTATAAARSPLQLLTAGAPRTARLALTSISQPPLRTSYSSSSCSLSRPPSQPKKHALSPPRSTTTPARRPYHSYDHPPSRGPFNEVEEAILSAAYKQVPEHGFSAEALAIGAREAGYLDISTTILPEGTFSLIRYHLVKEREALAARRDALFGRSEGEGQQQNTVSVQARVEALTWERLLGNAHLISRWQEALAIMAQPSYVPASLKELAMLADEIYFLAGDVSVDPSWYTKRASLSATYAAAELFMTNDHSPEFWETREFLRRRLGEASEVGSAVQSVREWVGFTASATVNVLRSKGVRI